MIIQSPGEVAFSVFGFSIFWYGIILAIAVFIGVVCAELISKKFYPEIKSDFIIDIAPLFIIAGIIGARLYYCFLNFGFYAENPLEILNIREGGLSIHGMIIVGILAVFYISKKCKVNFLSLLDILACSTLLAQSIGRWGNFFNSEAFGVPTNSTWGLFIPLSKRPMIFASNELFHPAFLYESVLDLLGFALLLFILKKTDRKGVTFFSYLIIYSLIRLFTEYLRLDSALNIGDLPIAQIMSAILILVGCIGLLFQKRD